MAGQYAGQAAANAMTQENLDYVAQHATVENAEKAYEGACWANDKADELGIDKKEVATAVGSGMWAGIKAMWSAGNDAAAYSQNQ